MWYKQTRANTETSYRRAGGILPRLTLSFLGCFHVCLDDRPVTDFKSNKVRALLAYLAVEADRPHRREVLAGLLWPDRTDRDALSNLRYALASLRRTIGDHAATPPFLLITPQTIQFNPASDHWLDVAELERQMADSSRWRWNGKWQMAQNQSPRNLCIAVASWPASPSAMRRLLKSGRCCGASRSACR